MLGLDAATANHVESNTMDQTVGSVPYLNAYPLVAACEHGPSEFAVRYDVPSRLPALLDSGEAAAILVSSIEALRRPNARIADDVSISSRGEVLSVRLFSRVPFGAIQTVALDQSSMTSNVLAMVLLREVFGTNPTSSPMPPDLQAMLAECDAGILIGDNGMRAEARGLHVLDLGAAWTNWTGLPFVWAVWLGGSGLTSEIAGALKIAREWGESNLGRLIPEAVERFGFDEAQTRRYLGEVMDYRLGPSHREALRRFGTLAQQHGLLEAWSEPECIGEVKSASLA